ncbi:MAG: hypothetical protein LBU39_02390, partial [Desulfobulbaceae bacterium]|nr:hypothetical protein [Desulfobulbaceae bacterium]
EQITGDGSKDRAEYAYTQLVAQVQAWQQENPGVEVHVSTVGFSRGTATQRQFANLVAERDTYLQTMRRWHQVFSIKAGAGATRKKSLRSESLDSPAALVAPV